ncbi:hypothetical protein ABXZ88_003077 [Vibrio fluvialis]
MGESVELMALSSKLRKEQTKAKKRKNQSSSAAMLNSNGIEYKSNNGGNHLVVTGAGLVIDFWPSTGKFIIRGDKRHFRGVRLLIKIARGDYTEQQLKALRGES